MDVLCAGFGAGGRADSASVTDSRATDRAGHHAAAVAVTMHGRVVAMLVPPGAAVRGRRRSKIDQMIADGTARPPLEDGDPLEGLTPLNLPPGTAAALIDADREDN